MVICNFCSSRKRDLVWFGGINIWVVFWVENFRRGLGQFSQNDFRAMHV